MIQLNNPVSKKIETFAYLKLFCESDKKITDDISLSSG